MDNNIQSTEITTDEGGKIQTIYETTTLQSINHIETINSLLSRNIMSLKLLMQNCSITMHEKYSKINQIFSLEPIAKNSKRKNLTMFKEMVIWRGTFKNTGIKK